MAEHPGGVERRYPLFHQLDQYGTGIDPADITVLFHLDLLLSPVLSDGQCDTWLFGGTVAENIAYSKPDATRKEIVAAARAAKVDYFIRTMPQGYDTILDNEAANLSAGQRQLITIARVFLCDPPIIILDEATSSVDTRTEVEIGKAMKKLMKGRTSFVIAHRLSTIRDADTILFMENGNIIEQGDHKELLAKNGAYAALYYSQFE